MYYSSKIRNADSLYGRQSSSCHNIFRHACLGDSSHPSSVTGPFIFPSSEGPYLMWPANVGTAVVELPSHYNCPRHSLCHRLQPYTVRGSTALLPKATRTCMSWLLPMLITLISASQSLRELDHFLFLLQLCAAVAVHNWYTFNTAWGSSEALG